MKFLKSALCVAMLLIATPLLVCAQQTGILSGTVHDATGAVIQGANVAVSGNGVQPQTITTTQTGTYTFSNLPPGGTYSIVVNSPGFKESKTDYVGVAAGETTPLEITLEPASVTTVETVQASGGIQVETENAEQSGTITEKQVTTYGLNGRNFTQMITLAPGVTNQTGQDEAKVGVAGSAKYSVNGGRVEYNAFDVDGSDVLNTGINASKGKSMPLIVYPSLDAIQEVKVLTSNYGAQYGRSASGSVLVTTKSGTEEYHGNLYEFFANQLFNARGYFDQTPGAPLFHKNDFGGTIGGPLPLPGQSKKSKKKTFFFFSEEARLEASPYNDPRGGEFNQAVPSNAERGLDANGHVVTGANGLPIVSFNDGITCPYLAPTGTTQFIPINRQLFPDCPTPNASLESFEYNSFPMNGVANQLLNPMGNPNASLIPLATPGAHCNGSTYCYGATVSPATVWYEELFRIDHNINDGERLGFRFIHDSWSTTVVSPQWGTVVSNSFPSVENHFVGPGISMVARLDSILSPTFLNQFSVSYTDTHISLTDVPGPGVNLERPSALDPGACPGATCLGYVYDNGFGSQLSNATAKLPGIIIGGNNASYGGNGLAVDTSFMPWDHHNPTWDIREGLSKVLGKHTVQVGIQVIYARQWETNGATGANTGDVQGLLTFSNVDSVASTGNAFADMVAGGQGFNGRPRYFQQDSTARRYDMHYTVIEPYVQDDWRATKRLTINMGIRFSLFGDWQMKHGEAWNWEQNSFSQSLASEVTIGGDGRLLSTSTGLPIPVSSANVNTVGTSPITNGLVECGTAGTPGSCMTSHIFNPAPRVGFAWDPTGSGKTSIRAGYGLFFEHGTSSESNVGSLIGNAPLVMDVTQNLPGGYNAIGNVDTIAYPIPGGAAAPPYAWPINVTSIPTKVVWPYVQQWSLGVQQQVSNDTLVSVAYVGSKGTHLTVQEQINQIRPVPTVLNPFGPGHPITTATCQDYQNGFSGSNGLASPLSPGDPAYLNLLAACAGAVGGMPDVNSLRQLAPGVGQIYSIRNTAESIYHALQITVQHNHGPLNLGVAYTFSHSIDDASDRYSATFVNAFDLRANRASSDYDMRQILNINYVYKLPLLTWYEKIWRALHCVKGDEATNVDCAKPGTLSTYSGPGTVLTKVLSGWNLSGITTFQTGTPFSVINGASPSGGPCPNCTTNQLAGGGVSVLDNAGLALGLGADSYPDRVRGAFSCDTAGSNINTFGPLLGNPCNYAAPRGLTQGNAGRNSLNNPGRSNFDMALFREMKVFGKHPLEVRAEAFNVFNHTQFRIYNPDRGNTGSNTVSCYGDATTGYSAGASNCFAGNSFLHPVDSRRPRTVQLGIKFGF